MARIIDGRAIARETSELVASGVTPGLAVIIVGEDPASHVYVRSKIAG